LQKTGTKDPQTNNETGQVNSDQWESQLNPQQPHCQQSDHDQGRTSSDQSAPQAEAIGAGFGAHGVKPADLDDGDTNGPEVTEFMGEEIRTMLDGKEPVWLEVK
jgi:hypothetical protein